MHEVFLFGFNGPVIPHPSMGFLILLCSSTRVSQTGMQEGQKWQLRLLIAGDQLGHCYSPFSSAVKEPATASEGEASVGFKPNARTSLSKSACFFPFQHSRVLLAFSLLLSVSPIELNRSYSTDSKHRLCSCLLRYQISLPWCWHLHLPYAKHRGRSRHLNKTWRCSLWWCRNWDNWVFSRSPS